MGCSVWRRSLIVVDSSAVVAILFGEPSAQKLLERLAADPERIISLVNYVETGTVLAGRRTRDRAGAINDLDAFLNAAGITLAPIDAAQARFAPRQSVEPVDPFGSRYYCERSDAISWRLHALVGIAASLRSSQ